MKIVSVRGVYISPRGNVVIEIVYEDENGELQATYRVMDPLGQFIGGFYDSFEEAKHVADNYVPVPSGGGGPKI